MLQAGPHQRMRHRHIEPHGLIVMGHRRLATNLKDREVVVHAVKASIPVGPLDPVSIATNIQGREPADVHRFHPTGERFGLTPSGLYRPHIERSKSLHAS
jgi:hypothetical protein